MNRREDNILQGLVEEYIYTGEPVGSFHLGKVLELEESPATIRNIFRNLEDEGYIEQPHTSAGRVPTDAGYRHYVDRVSVSEPSKQKVRYLKRQMRQYGNEYESPSLAMAKLLANLSHVLAVTGWMTSRDIHEAGLKSLIHEWDEEYPYIMQDISMFLDDVDAYIDKISDLAGSDTQVYIGGENPVSELLYTSMLVRKVKRDRDEDIIMLLVGPKRMQYKKNVSLLYCIASLVEQG